jgi:hypothetical protein
MNRRIVGILGNLALMLLMATTAIAQDQTSFAVSGRYTAQRKPRVTVLEFENTNAQAQSARYGSSVQAMLVTFLKRKSQFVVVERQKLGDVIQEWQRNQRGITNLQPTDPGAQELLEKLDAIVLGNVTLLDSMAEATVTRRMSPDKSGSQEVQQEVVRGPRIEIDAKLLSRADGRIIAAAQRSGPVSCLRSIVERLGIALEQEFLRPYYGKLKVNLTDPEYVRIYLTPILLDTALDEEKPPAERSATVIIGGDRDIVEPWTTDPTSYTIENLLSGWYSMRLERPGYEGLGTENSRWEARDTFGEIQIYDRVSNILLASVEPGLSRFVVHVDPLSTALIGGDALGFQFRKKAGSLDPRVKRQYLDTDYSQKPQRVILIAKDGLEINTYDPPTEYAEDETCDLFDERLPRPADYGRTYLTSGQQFDFTTFKGGELIFDDYQNELLPVGQYQMTLWEPDYQILTTDVNVRDRDQNKTTRSALVRNTLSLSLSTTGARPLNKLLLQGTATKQRIALSLDFESGKVHNGLPVDLYMASTDIPGLGHWQKTINLQPKEAPPIYDPQSKENPPLKSSAEGSTAPSPGALIVKTRLSVGGRIEVLGKELDPKADNVYVDSVVSGILDALFEHQKKEDEKDQHDNPSPGEAPKSSGSGSLRDPETLHAQLATHLADLDLLILGDKDMKRLRRDPEAAAQVKKFLESGGALFAFVMESGDYKSVVGAPLVLRAKKKETNRFEVVTGEIPGLRLEMREKKVKVKAKRILPEIEDFGRGWRVIAYSKGHKDPRIVEWGSRDQGGYIVLWCDDPGSFRSPKGGSVPDVEAVRTKVESHILDWARYLMYRRFDSTGDERRHIEQTLFP